MDRDLFENIPNSYWISSTEVTNYPTLQDNIDVDVAIIGGGMVGIMTAYLLKKSGVTVAIFEGDRIVRGTTGHTTAKITSQHGLLYNNLTQDFGIEKAKQYAQSNEWAISFIENTISDLGIDCDFSKQNAYVYTQDEAYLKQIREEVNAANKIGINATFEPNIELPFHTLGAIKFLNQAQFHPRKYLLSIANHLIKNGSSIFENTEITDIDRGDPCTLTTKANYKIHAKEVVVACHFPFSDNIGFYFARMYEERSYIIGIKIQEELPKGMYITAEPPTRSLRAQRYGSDTLLLLGGENHKIAHGPDTSEHYINLYNFAKQYFTIDDMPFRWSTQDIITPDNIPYIGNITRFSDRVYIGTGFKKWGMTSSHVAAKIISDTIVNKKNQWRDLYNPSRVMKPKSILKLVSQNIHVAKDLLSGKLTDLPSELEIIPGKGTVLEINGQKYGAYMHEDKKIYFVDTTCTHMGCELRWNSAEKTWDCPCHGSRFDYMGNIIDGPALSPLQ